MKVARQHHAVAQAQLFDTPPELSLDALRPVLDRARLLARAWSGTITETRRGDQAATFTQRALVACANVAVPNLMLSTPFGMSFGSLDHVAAQLAETIGRDAARLPLIEGLYFVTSLYPYLLPAQTRSSLGAFYTPPALVTRLLDQATDAGVDWRTARVLDPAAGGGAFLLQAAHRMRLALGPCEPAFALQNIAGRLVGLELDPHAANLAQAALEILLGELVVASNRATPTMVRACDSLEAAPEENFDLVVGNPPYGRTALTPDQRRRFCRSLYGHANLYGVFTDIALRWTKPGGLIAYLTPTSFLAGQYYAALRGLLGALAPPLAMDFIHARRGVFEDVLQETMLAVYRKGAERHRIQVHYLHIASEHEIRVVKNGSIGLPDDPAAPWLAPRNAEHGPLISHAAKMPARLVDWGYAVSTGPLVWNRFKSQLRSRSDGKRVHPLVWAEAITADGRFVFRAQKRNHAPYFKLDAGDEWLLIAEPCVLLQRTTAKEQARRLIAAELPAEFIARHGGVVVENHLNMIRSNGAPKVSLAVLAAMFNSEAVDQMFRCMSGSVAVSAFELHALPLPGPGDLTTLTRLVGEGAERDRIETECWRLYGRAG